ncbi:hypothetical protein SATRM34S_04534 [Streptomyces atroolivaceus]
MRTGVKVAPAAVPGAGPTALSVAWCTIGPTDDEWPGVLWTTGRTGARMSITNLRMTEYGFLRGLYRDGYYPGHVVDRGRAVLVRLCERIEAERPADLTALYGLTHAATEEFNALQADFEAAGSEIETVAREEIAEDFWAVAMAYGFTDADVEELIAPRDW